MDDLNYEPPNWEDMSRKELTYDENGQPHLKIWDFSQGGSTSELTGMQALKYAPRKAMGVADNTMVIAPDYYGEGDAREGYPYKIGKWLRSKITPDPFDHWSPTKGGLIWGGAGFGLGKLIEKLTGTDSKLPGLIGALAGGGFGVLRAYNQDKELARIRASRGYKDPNLLRLPENMFIKSSMYRDPRNFILERLQGATDISPFQKAQLAAKVRQMNTMDAERLKSKVRAAVGFGVGALIARFFGTGLMGSAIGGLLGAFVGSKFPSTGNAPPTGIFSRFDHY